MGAADRIKPLVNIGDAITVDMVVTQMMIPTKTPWVFSVGMEKVHTPHVTSTPWVITATAQPPVKVEKTPWWDQKYYVENPGLDLPDMDQDEIVRAKISYFWPPWGEEKGGAYEINCDKVDDVLECETMASGQRVIDWIGKAVACPGEYEFGTIFEIYGRAYSCQDRGGAIIKNEDGSIWLDVLYDRMPAARPWGDQIEVKVWRENHGVED